MAAGIYSGDGQVTVADSTIANNFARLQHGGGITASGDADRSQQHDHGQQLRRHTTAVVSPSPRRLERKSATPSSPATAAVVGSTGGPDIAGAPITFSNGHNVFGSDVAGSVAGDRENIAPGADLRHDRPRHRRRPAQPQRRRLPAQRRRQPGAHRRRSAGRQHRRPARHQRAPAARRQPARHRLDRDQPAALDRRHRQQRRAHRHMPAATRIAGTRTATTCCGGWAAPTR